MASNFPGGLDSYVTKQDNVDDVLASHVNGLQDAVEALEAKVGVDSSAITTSHDYKLRHLPAQEQNFDAGSFKLTSRQLESDVATGTAPLIVASTTKVDNLNADKLDGYEASELAISSGIIGMWSGALASIPAGWVLCDGNNGTKDLRGKMIPCTKSGIEPGAVSGNDYIEAHNHAKGTLTFTIPNHLHITKVSETGRTYYSVGGPGGTQSSEYFVSSGGGGSCSGSGNTASIGSASIYALAYVMKT